MTSVCIMQENDLPHKNTIQFSHPLSDRFLSRLHDFDVMDDEIKSHIVNLDKKCGICI